MAVRVDQYCAARGLSESALIKSSLSKYLDGTNDATLLLRRMDRLGRARERVDGQRFPSEVGQANPREIGQPFPRKDGQWNPSLLDPR
jgi:hypothetical protein